MCITDEKCPSDDRLSYKLKRTDYENNKRSLLTIGDSEAKTAYYYNFIIKFQKNIDTLHIISY